MHKALRIFLQSIHIPSQASHGANALHAMLDSFASRWYEANASHVAYDRDMAYCFTRAIIQLNDVLHSDITLEPGPTGYVRSNITVWDFLDAFRRRDPRSLLSDDVIGDICNSIRREDVGDCLEHVIFPLLHCQTLSSHSSVHYLHD